MEDTELALKEIHDASLNVLKKIIEICDLLGVSYFLYYGSLLGAIRHGGFIPWDDDIDIAMGRPDYEKFCKYCYSNQCKLYPYRLIDKNVEKNYQYNIPRFCNLEFRMVSDEPQTINMGVFVDIYPLDGIGNNKRYNFIYKVKKWFYYKENNFKIKKCYIKSPNGIIKSILNYLMYVYSKMYPEDYFLRQLDKLAEKYEFRNSKYVACVVWDAFVHPILKDDIENLTECPFESIKSKIIKNYDYFLKELYGDYLELPPKDQQVPHHEYKIYKISSEREN